MTSWRSKEGSKPVKAVEIVPALRGPERPLESASFTSNATDCTICRARGNNAKHASDAVVCDVTRPEQVQHAIYAIISKFGRIYSLINNAGQGLHATIEDIKLDDFKDLLNLNTVAPLAMMQAVIPYMRKQGRGSIVNVNVSSGATLATYPGSAAYTSSKAALNMLSSVARLELAEAGIAVSVMHPSITSTDFYGSVKSGLTSAKAQEVETVSFAHPPELVAETILRLIKSGDAQADLVAKEYCHSQY
ncbi:SDR family NAD(P)-dependent oxidoreductase [Pseudomonas syringae]|uniref:SDR family NAD(P)-dependent oxidoreductase n=1 Tax=Pseudomonas syringae TaxID=317 RepID=UPI001F366749|nr:SDR family NAD(P)-dependent oxidoreductase [Pseudomonas syringae]MCF5651446.1 SDR family NAD(P)-dependent oxidoreductase [Pseudomonas syringae]